MNSIRLPLCFICIFLIASCTNSKTAANRGKAPDAKAICDNPSQDFPCAQKVELAFLKHYNDLVTKEKEHTLILKLQNGKTKSYQDVLSDSYETAISYNFVGYLDSLNYYVIRLQYYEGGGFMLVDQKDGQEYPISDFPVLSPNGNAFVCAHADVAAGYDPNSLQIWHISSGKPLLSYELNPKDWGPSKVNWLGNERIKVIRVSFDQNALKEIFLAPMELNNVGGRWKLK